MSKTREIVLSLDELDELCKLLPNEGVILLQGDLASGKTSLVQAFAKFKGIKEEPSSPTFSVMQSYENENGFKLFHYDIYQNGFKALLENGLFENFFEKGLHLVEWGDEKLYEYLKNFGIEAKKIQISNLKDKRKYQIYE
ncbi:tRNA (adenosine(37)-N6)-threonylcarbamoyltransferase complex ATPase subunit type 1 TsaE [Campylobacter sp. MIT 99-7217]|uniref:tRNA (adenosine(37)-N6)-threonylcarbamoyltransferase complex ATPase subunit type 1 TsaE n=1 Tax=Campylobacter sp. MIT 99-7217 TaxID=535091 RepID=UPI00115BD01F|nr:tRNA (adenosine(37)-N6)-threonylcarbamoyltransferase complex ATPase subunit type 1 TsaE [Campylobacter sp. MIT 99-7217]TQR34701.1 tRNA (adenosine(37)-N6)-threonylcarbamoyltransferase complex ATPase subunit type 1 TsaE [Campylobacter sp. MIT 99-7217]